MAPTQVVEEARSENESRGDRPDFASRNGAAWFHPAGRRGAAYFALRLKGQPRTFYALCAPLTRVGPQGQRGPDYEGDMRIWIEEGRRGRYMKVVLPYGEPLFLFEDQAEEDAPTPLFPPLTGASKARPTDASPHDEAVFQAVADLAHQDPMGASLDAIGAACGLDPDAVEAAVDRLAEAGRVFEPVLGRLRPQA